MVWKCRSEFDNWSSMFDIRTLTRRRREYTRFVHSHTHHTHTHTNTHTPHTLTRHAICVFSQLKCRKPGGKKAPPPPPPPSPQKCSGDVSAHPTGSSATDPRADTMLLRFFFLNRWRRLSCDSEMNGNLLFFVISFFALKLLGQIKPRQLSSGASLSRLPPQDWLPCPM